MAKNDQPVMPVMNKNGVVEGDDPPVVAEAAIEAIDKPHGRKVKVTVKKSHTVHDGKGGFLPVGHEFEAHKGVAESLKDKGYIE